METAQVLLDELPDPLIRGNAKERVKSIAVHAESRSGKNKVSDVSPKRDDSSPLLQRRLEVLQPFDGHRLANMVGVEPLLDAILQIPGEVNLNSSRQSLLSARRVGFAKSLVQVLSNPTPGNQERD